MDITPPGELAPEIILELLFWTIVQLFHSESKKEKKKA